MAEERYVKKSEFVGQAVIPISRSDGDVVYVPLGDGEVIKGDSSDPNGFSKVSIDDLSGGISTELGQSFQLNTDTGFTIDQDTPAETPEFTITVSNNGKQAGTIAWASIDEVTPSIIHLVEGTFLVTCSLTVTASTDLSNISVAPVRSGGSPTSIETYTLIRPVHATQDAPDVGIPDENGYAFMSATYLVSMSAVAAKQAFKVSVFGQSTEPTFTADVSGVNAIVTRIG